MTGSSLETAVADMAYYLGNDVDTAHNVGPSLTCTELDSIVAVLTAGGFANVAEHWVRGHVESESEDIDDKHFNVVPEMYVLHLQGQNVGERLYNHTARPDDNPGPGDQCKDCGRDVTWVGPSTVTDWAHVSI